MSSQKTLDVVGAGSWTNFDHLFVVDRLPAPGDTVQITGAVETVEQVFFGGCAPNNVAAVARLGGRAGLIGVVGHDFVTRGYRQHFEQLGVDLNGVIMVEDGHCGHSFLYSDAEGQSICLSHLGVAAHQETYEPNAEILKQARVTVLNYRFDSHTLRAAHIAKEASGLVILSGALITAPDYAQAFVDTTDILICTDHELQQLVSHLGLEDQNELFRRGLRAVIATRGKSGSHIILPDRTVDVPISQATHVVDPTGAGDSFVGGTAYGLASGCSIEDATRLGAVVASFVVEARGCQTNLPTFEQAAERYTTNYHSTIPVVSRI